MTYPTESFAGAATPTHITATFSASAMSGTFHDLSTWTELGTNDPLGTSGDFVITVDYGKTSEEKIRCSALDLNTGVITFVERGFDDTTPAVHSPGVPSKPNCFPVLSASDMVAVQEEIAVARAEAQTAQNDATEALSDASDALSAASTALSTANTALSNAATAQSTANTAETHAQTAITNAATAQSTANSKVASVSAGNSTVTIGGTSTAPTVAVTPNTFDAYGAAASKVASVTAADGTITVAGTSTAPTVAVGTVPYSQVSGTPSSLPPSGSAGGDLSGSYPNPSLAALSPSPSGTYGSSTKMPVITVDSKGRITSASEITPATDSPSGPAGGDLSGTYPNPTVVAGSTTQAGKLQLTDSTSSTSTSTAATPNAVKTAYDLASTANSAASTAQSTANSKVASVTAADSTVTIGGTATAPTVKVTANTFDAYGAAASKVASVTAGDTSITVAGTATAPTVAVNQANLTIAESQVTGLVTDLSGKVATTRTISTTSPLSGGGDLSANRTLSIADASTTAKGAVQLTDSTASTSTTTAATPNSVKSAYDLANTANTTANAATPQTRTISTTSPLSGGGDLSANRTLSIADASTSAKGAVQLSDSTSSTSTSLAATANAVKTSYDLANAALPKAGGTMSGDIDLNSVARIKNLVLPGASTDVARASQLSAMTNISINSTTSVPLKAWNGDPANITTFTSQTATMASGIMAFTAITLPYAATLTGVTIWQTTGAVPGTTGAVYQLGLYDTNGNLLASTPNNSGNAFLALTGFFGWAFSSTYSATAGNYMIGMLWNSGTGGSPTVPIFGKPSNAGATQVNLNCPTPSSGKLDQRSCTAGTGRTSLYNPMNVTPTASNSNFWAGLY